MNDTEVNKIIAEYMGWEDYPPHNETIGYSAKVEDGGYVVELPTNSLDALVPVWGKLRMGSIKLNIKDALAHVNCPNYWQNEQGDTIQQAAAHATAKCILELGES